MKHSKIFTLVLINLIVYAILIAMSLVGYFFVGSYKIKISTQLKETENLLSEVKGNIADYEQKLKKYDGIVKDFKSIDKKYMIIDEVKLKDINDIIHSIDNASCLEQSNVSIESLNQKRIPWPNVLVSDANIEAKGFSIVINSAFSNESDLYNMIDVIRSEWPGVIIISEISTSLSKEKSFSYQGGYIDYQAQSKNKDDFFSLNQKRGKDKIYAKVVVNWFFLSKKL